MVDFGLDKDGGFIALDTERKVAAYAYRTSIHWSEASRGERLESIAREMLASESEWMHRLHPDFYARMAERLGKAI